MAEDQRITNITILTVLKEESTLLLIIIHEIIHQITYLKKRNLYYFHISVSFDVLFIILFFNF